MKRKYCALPESMSKMEMYGFHWMEFVAQIPSPLYTIVGGVPARHIRRRFDEGMVTRLMELKWWEWPDEKIKENLPTIQSGRINELKWFLGLWRFTRPHNFQLVWELDRENM